jgi:hypothetical protein
MRRIALAILTVLGLTLALVPGPVAAAAPLDRFHDRWDFVVDDFDLCGFNTTAHFSGQQIGLVRADPDNLDTLLLSRHVHTTFTSTDTGKMLVITGDETSSDLVVTTDGVRVYDTYQLSGRTIFANGDGTILDQRAGRIIYTDVINLNGTPDDGSDDYLETFTIDFIAGPHPFAEGGITCDAAEKSFG